MGTAVHSIRGELAVVRPFVDRVISGCYSCYSEEDIRNAEKRLGIALPAPVRELYELMADLLIAELSLTPLELLHWEQDFLGFFESPDDSLALGIRKGDDHNQLYQWELHDPEEESYDYWDEFTELCEEGDRKGRQKLARRCCAYWKGIHRRYPDYMPPAKKLENKAQYNCAVDAYGLFLTLLAANEAYESFQREHFDFSVLLRYDLDYSGERIPGDDGSLRIPEEYFFRLHQRITQEFTPLSSRPQLLALETPGLQMAYRHREQQKLLLMWDWDTALTLLTLDPQTCGLPEILQD